MKIKSSIIIILALFFIISNFLVSKLPLRLDFSKGQAYSLSASTKKIIKNLDSKVDIKVFISSDLPQKLLPLKNDVLDFINEYEKSSGGKIAVKILNPKKDSTALQAAKEAGIPQLQFSQIENDKYAVVATYFGIAFYYGDKKEIIPQATNLASLEYDITSLIYKMTQKAPIKIGLIGGDGIESFKKILSQQFDLEPINMPEDPKEQKIDSSIKTLLVVDDYSRVFSDSEKKALSQYINSGGKSIIMADGIYLADSLETSEAKHNLFDFFENYGLRLNRDFVLSSSSELANFTMGQTSFFTAYPFWVKTANFLKADSTFSNIQSLSFPWISSISISAKKGVTTKVLVKSEKKSWRQQQNFILEPNKIPEPKENEFKEQNLVAEAKLKSGGQLILIPSSRFVKEEFIQGNLENIGFLLNLVNKFASGGSLSGIRARSISVSPIRDYSESTKDIIKYLNIFLLPGLFGLFGLSRIFKKK